MIERLGMRFWVMTVPSAALGLKCQKRAFGGLRREEMVAVIEEQELKIRLKQAPGRPGPSPTMEQPTQGAMTIAEM